MANPENEADRQPEEEPVTAEDLSDETADAESEEDIESRQKQGEEALEEINEFLAFFKC